jgi:hypothetical protein
MKPVIRVPLAILVTSAAISVGLIGVHASEQCVRFIKHRRHHTAATLAAWAAWDKAHPNWHPKPVNEAIAAVDFACSLPLIQKPVDGELPPLNLEGFDFPMGELPPPVTPTLIARNEPPPIIFADTPALPLVSPPIYSPEYPTMFGGFPPPHTAPPSITPEPSSWTLLATSLLAMGALAKRRRTLCCAVARR